MSEYIDIETELGDDGVVLFHTNLKLTAAGRREYYASADELAEGSPVAQALVVVADGRPAGVLTKLDLLEHLAHRTAHE